VHCVLERRDRHHNVLERRDRHHNVLERRDHNHNCFDASLAQASMADAFKIHLSDLPKATPRAHVLEALAPLIALGFPMVVDVKVFSTNTSTISSALVTLAGPIAESTCVAWHGHPWYYGSLHCRPADAKKACPCGT
jgi:hypothetical protein